MKRKLIIYVLLAGSALVGLWLLGALVRWKNPQIVLPTNQIETAFDAIAQRREAEAESETQARQDQIFQDELLAAHAAVKSSLVDWRQADAALACARAQHLFTKWQQWSTQTGKSLEMVYRDEFAAHLTRLRDWQQRTNAGIVGTPDQIAEARAVVADTQVFLMLGDLMYSQQSAPLCDNRIDSEIVKLSLVYSEVAARVDGRNDQLRELEQTKLESAAAYWNGEDSVAAPVEAEPVNTEPNRLYNFVFGGTDDD